MQFFTQSPHQEGEDSGESQRMHEYVGGAGRFSQLSLTEKKFYQTSINLRQLAQTLVGDNWIGREGIRKKPFPLLHAGFTAGWGIEGEGRVLTIFGTMRHV